MKKMEYIVQSVIIKIWKVYAYSEYFELKGNFLTSMNLSWIILCTQQYPMRSL